jgi:hypothetical protein
MLRTRMLTLVVVLLMLVASWGGDAQGQASAPEGVDGTTYTSPLFGYSISWDEEYWVVADGTAIGDQGDRLRLDVGDAGVGALELVWFPWTTESQSRGADGYVEELVNRLINASDLSDVHQAEANGNPIGEGDETSAYAVYEYRSGNVSMAHYLECRHLSPSEVGFCVAFITPREQFNTHLPHVQEVLATLSLPATD